MTPAERRRAQVEDAFRARFARVLDAPMGSQVVRCAEHLHATLDAYRYPAEKRTAMAVRLAERWPLLDLAEDDASLYDVADAEHRADAVGEDYRFGWPSNISLDDVTATIERGRTKEARAIADAMRNLPRWAARRWSGTGIATDGGLRLVSWSVVEAIEKRQEQGIFSDDPAINGSVIVAEGDSPFDPRLAALVAWAAKVVEEDQRRALAFPVPARRAAHRAIDMLARSKAMCADERGPLVEHVREGGVRLIWDGTTSGPRYGFADLDMPMSMALGIKNELGAEGLRDYLILHRMAAAQGRTGSFRWTWEAHRHATRHATRVRASNTTDDEARDAVVRRIWKLARAQLHVEVEEGGRRAWQVVGKDMLVFVEGGVEKGGHIEGLILRLNPALYDGARKNAGRPYFTLLPEAVLDLPASALCLATLLVFRWRNRRDEGGVVELDEAALLRLMDETTLTASRHRTSATEKLHATLALVATAMGNGFAWEPVEGGKYRITPPRFWVDAVVYRTAPVLPPMTRDAPATGLQLVEWRKTHGLTQARAAAVLGVSVRTVSSAERTASAKLPRSFANVHWEAVRALART